MRRINSISLFVAMTSLAPLANAGVPQLYVQKATQPSASAAHAAGGMKVMDVGLAATNGTNVVRISSALTPSSNSTATANIMDLGASIGVPGVMGTGCQGNHVSATLSPDGSALTVLFDDYTVTANASVPVDRKNCSMSIPITIPYGYSVTFTTVDYRGFTSVPYGAGVDFELEYFFAGASTVPYTQHFRNDASGDASGNFLLQDTIDSSNVTWTRCGTESATMRINNSLVATTNVLGDETIATLDTVDITLDNPAGRKGLILYLLWNPCATSGAASTAASLGALIPLGLAAVAAMGL